MSEVENCEVRRRNVELCVESLRVPDGGGKRFESSYSGVTPRLRGGVFGVLEIF